MDGPARTARPAPHPYVQVASLALVAVVAWKLAGEAGGPLTLARESVNAKLN